MLEKLAEMVREEGLPPVHYCEYCKRYNPLACECRHTEGECEPAVNKKNRTVARWAVLLVAKGLEKEIDRLSLFRGLPPSEAAMEAAARLGASIYNLITEAKEGGEWPPRPR